jgi:hypothetical protein
VTAVLHISAAPSIVRLASGETPHVAATGRPADPCIGMNVPVTSEGEYSVILTPARVWV